MCHAKESAPQYSALQKGAKNATINKTIRIQDRPPRFGDRRYICLTNTRQSAMPASFSASRRSAGTIGGGIPSRGITKQQARKNLSSSNIFFAIPRSAGRNLSLVSCRKTGKTRFSRPTLWSRQAHGVRMPRRFTAFSVGIRLVTDDGMSDHVCVREIYKECV